MCLGIAAGASVRRDPFAFEKNLAGWRRLSRFDLGADEAIGDAVIMVIDLDVIVPDDCYAIALRCRRGISSIPRTRRTRPAGVSAPDDRSLPAIVDASRRAGGAVELR